MTDFSKLTIKEIVDEYKSEEKRTNLPNGILTLIRIDENIRLNITRYKGNLCIEMIE